MCIKKQTLVLQAGEEKVRKLNETRDKEKVEMIKTIGKTYFSPETDGRKLKVLYLVTPLLHIYNSHLDILSSSLG